MAEPDVAPAGGARNLALGRPRVTVRPHYEGLPFSGLDGTGRAGRKPRARAGEEPAVRVPEATVPEPKIAAVERRKATRLTHQARGPQGPDQGGANRRSAYLGAGR